MCVTLKKQPDTSNIDRDVQTVFYHNVDNSIPTDFLDDYVKRHTADKIVAYYDKTKNILCSW